MSRMFVQRNLSERNQPMCFWKKCKKAVLQCLEDLFIQAAMGIFFKVHFGKVKCWIFRMTVHKGAWHSPIKEKVLK
jgi:hypothetical protein